jgi:hypothetical protein
MCGDEKGFFPISECFSMSDRYLQRTHRSIKGIGNVKCRSWKNHVPAFLFFPVDWKETCGPTPFFLLLYFLFPSQVNQRCNHLLLLWVSCKRNIIYLHHIASISWTCSPRKKNASPYFLTPHLNVIFTSTPFCLNRYQYGAGIRSQGSSIQHYCCKGKKDMAFGC